MVITPSYSGRRPEAKSGEFLLWNPRWGCIHTYHSTVNRSRLLFPSTGLSLGFRVVSECAGRGTFIGTLRGVHRHR